MEPGTTYQWNIRARVVDENGATFIQSPWSASHQYTTLPACANLTDLSVNSEANLVYFNANKPSGEWDIWAIGKIREVGSNNYRYLATTVDNYANQVKYNFTPSTDYEWHTKAWCKGNVDEDGNSDSQYHSGWGEFSTFTTQDPCDKLPVNLAHKELFNQCQIYYYELGYTTKRSATSLFLKLQPMRLPVRCLVGIISQALPIRQDLSMDKVGVDQGLSGVLEELVVRMEHRGLHRLQAMSTTH